MFAGGSASGTGVSIGSSNFSGFLFLSLGFLKGTPNIPPATPRARPRHRTAGDTRVRFPVIIVHGRQQQLRRRHDLRVLVNSTQGADRLQDARPPGGVVPLVLFWQLRLWLATVRGHMHSDPLVYATRDRISFLVVGLVVVFYALATVGVPFITE